MLSITTTITTFGLHFIGQIVIWP